MLCTFPENAAEAAEWSTNPNQDSSRLSARREAARVLELMESPVCALRKPYERRREAIRREAIRATVAAYRALSSTKWTVRWWRWRRCTRRLRWGGGGGTLVA